MNTKWPETHSFLDLKERHQRNRQLRARSPHLLPRGPWDGQTTLRTGMVAGAAAAVGLVVLVSIGHLCPAALQSICANVNSRWKTFEVASAVGSPRWTKDGRRERVLQVGNRLEGGFRIIQGKGSSTTLVVSGNCKIAVAGAAALDVGPVEMPAESREKSRLTLALQSGTLGVELEVGRPIVEVRLPQGSVIYGRYSSFVVAAGSTQSVVSVRRGKIKIRGSDRKKYIYLGEGQRLTIGSCDDGDRKTNLQ